MGRAGCAWVHDHPGIRSTVWLAVRYPGGQRFDLGLLEMLFLALLAVCFLLLARKPRAPGFFAGWTFVIYGSFRVGLDQLHANPPRRMGITPDEVFGILLAGLGLLTLTCAAATRRRNSAGR